MQNNFLDRLIKSYRKRGRVGVIFNLAIDFYTHLRDHGGSFKVVGKPKDSTTLIIVLAGYKPRLWPITLRRLAEHAPSDAAVCVVTAGKHNSDLLEMCSRNGWTYVSTGLNKTGLALNKAIRVHRAADWIFKLDEDIFIGEGFFEDLKRGYQAILANGIYDPGFCAPTLNVNGVSYKTFLEKIGKDAEYFERFGELRVACDGVRAHFDPAAARWLWRESLPLDAVVGRFRSFRREYKDYDARLIGSRFSIGAILLRRDFLTRIGGFQSAWRQGILGIDESALCTACVAHSRPMFYLGHVFAGHFSFYLQEKAMLDAWPEFERLDPATFVR